MMRKRSLVIVLILVIIFAILQIIRPGIKNEPATSAEIKLPGNVKSVLVKACYDCHSNQTNLRWYDQVVPAYWKVAEDIKAARLVLNFSEWDKLAKPDQQAKLWEALNQIKGGTMPISAYTAIHPSTKLTASEVQILQNYLLSIVKPINYDRKADSAADQQFAHWTGESQNTAKAPIALNGVAFDPDYKNWQIVSVSDRFDNGTMRLILGNPAAVDAIHNHQISPWPNGAVFAKVAYAEKADPKGRITTGEFKQVEFMIKNAEKYQSTGGWGFARFKTMKLKPYGKTVLFATECINCHRPEEKTDFVFTQPIQLYQ